MIAVQGTDNIYVAGCLCPDCGTPIVLVSPSQAERFACGFCASELEIRGGFVVERSYGSSSRIHQLSRRM